MSRSSAVRKQVEESLPYQLLSNEELSVFNQLSSIKAAFAVASQWVIMAAAIATSLYFHHWAVYVAAVIIIGSRQHALSILMHEAAHLHLLKGPKTGTLISQILLAYPLGLSTTIYRHKHIAHHRFTSTENDPDFVMQRKTKEWQWPKTKREALILFARDLVGLNLHDSYKIFSYWSPVPVILGKEIDPSLKISRNEVMLFICFNLALVATVIATGIWKEVLLYWYVPLFTYTSFAARVRAITEHNGVKESKGELGITRNIKVGLVERFLISPCNINHHLTHHLYPSIPFYNLPAATKALEEKRGFAEYAETTIGYFNPKTGALKRIIKLN